MAPRWSNSGSSWSRSSSGLNKGLIAAVAIALVVGLVGGYAFGGRGSSSKTAAVDPRATPVAESNVAGMEATFDDQGGAVKAATSLIVGFPSLATQPSLQRTQALDKIVSPNAISGVRTTLESSIDAIRTQLFGDGQTTTARVVTTPLAYKSTLAADKSVTVTIWYTSVLADATGARFRSSWATATIRLGYTTSWQVLAFDNADGPTPELYSTDGKADDINGVIPILNNAFAYRYALAP